MDFFTVQPFIYLRMKLGHNFQKGINFFIPVQNSNKVGVGKEKREKMKK
jgi:hypothetical protein